MPVLILFSESSTTLKLEDCKVMSVFPKRNLSFAESS